MLTRQRGMSTSGLILTIGVVGFFLTLLFKMGPSYLDNMGVRSAMKSMLNNNPNIADMSKDKIYSQLSSYFTINGVRDVNPKDMVIVRRKDRTLINHEYEVRVPVFYNVDVVMSFKNQIDSSNADACCTYLIDDEGKSVKKQ
ncbi:DUF4845 domain-containing protein [Agaribacterium haliotis]|uniref:DUF4845 domain-containing protein n=1 Tax=Agaribacterium haliotis TaxID=2013869 RepID=UPI000BB56071|nr:DUF4845 domain-containing protein [Agaribacterium haliotis]